MKMLLLLIILSFAGLQATKLSIEDFKCNVRYELAAALKREEVCKQWMSLHPICKMDLEVAYSEAAPYVYVENDSKKVHGVIPGIFAICLYLSILISLIL